jgi:hypothetical protein
VRRLAPFAAVLIAWALTTSTASPAGAVVRPGAHDVTPCDGLWHKLRSPNPAHRYGDLDSLVAASSLSSTDAWAAGTFWSFSAARYDTLTEHWDGSTWSLVSSPNSTKTTWNQLTGVAAIAPDDAWAVGYENSSDYRSLILHWDGTSWAISDDGSTAAFLTSVSALGPDDVWAAGSTNYVGTGLLMHWDGAAWTETLIPGSIFFRAIAALAPDDIWAVGQRAVNGEGDLTVAYHFDGTSWTRSPTPNPLRLHDIDQNWLTSISAVASNDIWATGVARDHDYGILDHPFTAHWDGSTWSLVSTPDPGGSSGDTDLWDSVALASDDVWAVGSVGNEPDWSTLTLHWDGLAWTQLSSSTPGRFLATAPDLVGGIWGLGDRSVSQPSYTATMVQHFC